MAVLSRRIVGTIRHGSGAEAYVALPVAQLSHCLGAMPHAILNAAYSGGTRTSGVPRLTIHHATSGADDVGSWIMAAEP